MTSIDLNPNGNPEDKGVNLILGDKSIMVDDHDESVPEDLIPGASDMTADLSSFSLKEYKTWIYSGLAVIVLIGVIMFLLNKENSTIEQKLEDTTEDVVSSTENLPSFFTANLLQNGLGGEAPDGVDGAGDPIGPQVPDNTDPVFDPGTALGDTQLPDSNLDDPLGGIALDTPDSTANPSTDTGNDIFADILGNPDAYNSAATATDMSQQIDTSLSLNTNTAPETMMSGELEGDTGPALWLAFVPTLAYAVTRKRKK
jgi:hypothetical protein